jgi:hypothetical protein
MNRQFLKIDNYLLEWVYDSANTIVEPYKILTDTREGVKSYVGTGMSNNVLSEQLFLIDPIKEKSVRPDTVTYPFLTLTDHMSLGPVRHDRVSLYIPAGQGLGQARGISLVIYTLDLENRRRVILSRFYYDVQETDPTRVSVLSPPFLYDGRLWDRKISVEIPAPGAVSSQLVNGLPIPSSINDVLTDGRGVSLVAPLFIDFRVVVEKQVLGPLEQYISLPVRTVSFPREPELGPLSLMIRESEEGDYFEIHPIYAGSLESWRNFLNGSKTQNKDYVGEYVITLFEENRKGQVVRTSLTRQDMLVNYDFRPIVRTDSVRVVMDVEFRLLDRVAGTTVIKKASYGLLPEQTSKYSLRPKKINVGGVSRPRIYVRRERIAKESVVSDMVERKVVEKTVPLPVMFDNRDIHASSSRSVNRRSVRKVDNYHPQGLLRVSVPPFEGVIDVSVAVLTDTLEYVDFTGVGRLSMLFGGSTGDVVELDAVSVNGVTDPTNGKLTFRMRTGLYGVIKRIWDKGDRLFHIVSENRGIRTVVYTGQFVREDEVVDDIVDVIEVRDAIDLPPILVDGGDGILIPGGGRPGRGSRPVSALDPERGVPETPIALARRRQVNVSQVVNTGDGSADPERGT